jgi:hypothetical protein
MTASSRNTATDRHALPPSVAQTADSPAHPPGQGLAESLARLVAPLTDEIVAHVGGRVGRSEISQQVRIALQDLRGSVAFDSLAEMARRLAEHRLGTADGPHPWTGNPPPDPPRRS